MRLDHLLSKEISANFRFFSALAYTHTRRAKRKSEFHPKLQKPKGLSKSKRIVGQIPKVGRIEIFVETRNVLFVFECTIERLDIHS